MPNPHPTPAPAPTPESSPDSPLAHMIDRQIRPWNVLHPPTLTALRQTPRETFIPPDHQHLTYADTRIPLADGEKMFEPKITARLVQALRLNPNPPHPERILEIGTGSGYTAALLATLAPTAPITTLEINPRLFTQAQTNLQTFAQQNPTAAPITPHQTDAHTYLQNPPEKFTAILINASLPTTQHLKQWLTALAEPNQPATIVAIIGTPPIMQVIRASTTGDNNTITETSLFETTAPRLKNVEEKPQFQF